MRVRSLVARILRFPSVVIKARRRAASARLMQDLYRDSAAADAGEKVLFWVPGGTPGLLEVEGTLAAALRLRGVGVHAVLCDGPFDACVRREIENDEPLADWHTSCPACVAATTAVLDRLGIEYSFIGDYVPAERRAELLRATSGVTWDSLDRIHREGLHLEANVRSSIMRFLKGHPLTGHEEIVAPYAFSALLVAEAADSAIEAHRPSRIFMSHAVYIDWGPALSVSFLRGVPTVAWVPAFLQDRFYFRTIDDPVHSDLTKLSDLAWREARESAFGDEEAGALQSYMRDRYQRRIGLDLDGLADYVTDTAALRARYTLHPERPTWGIMAHVSWDSVTDYAPMAYEDFESWIADTVERISRSDDVNWIIKIHPYEARTNPDSGIERLIRTRFPSLPAHVRLVPAVEEINPLAFYDMVDGVVSVFGTGGLEMALLGKPVILAGEAYYGGKGFTYDGFDVESYRSLIESAGSLAKPNEAQMDLARRFAYTHFIRRQVPLPAIHNPGPYWWEFRLDKPDYWWEFQAPQRDSLLPGADAFLDFVCDRILDGRDFVLDDDLVAEAARRLAARGR